MVNMEFTSRVNLAHSNSASVIVASLRCTTNSIPDLNFTVILVCDHLVRSEKEVAFWVWAVAALTYLFSGS